MKSTILNHALYLKFIYFLLYFKVLSCGLGGEWSGKAPTCKFVDCGAPPNIDNGRYQLSNGTTVYGSLVEYQCGEDYWLDGQRIQQCTREGKWSGDAPSCECKMKILIFLQIKILYKSVSDLYVSAIHP